MDRMRRAICRMVDAGSVFGSLAGLPHFPMSFTSISADFGLSTVTGAFFVPLMNFELFLYHCAIALWHHRFV